MNDLFSRADNDEQEPLGTTRSPDHRTSKRAARRIAGVRRTVRQQVIEFALNARNGFTDEAMVKMRPDWCESTARKRRTELTEENIILFTGVEKTNSHGNPMKVWIHRSFVMHPPPIIRRTPRPPAKAKLEAEIRRLQDLLRRHGIEF